jgi:adenosylhomocysteine nucleosidase
MKAGIIGAERQEVELLFASLAEGGKPVKVLSRGKLEFYEGSLHGLPVVVVCCGIGKVNAALCAQMLISEFSVSCVINTGSAGGIEASLDVLDMVASTDAVQHDFDTTVFGYAPGQVPGTDSPFFAADAKLRAVALEAFSRAGRGGSHKMIEGRIASGDAFITDEGKRARIVELFSPACVEMEGAAIAQVCAANAVPFVILRSVSDKAGAEAGMSYDEFSKLASWTSAHVVMEMASLLAK